MTRKLTLALALCLSLFTASAALAQGGANVPNRGHAPAQPDGVGRLDLRVFDSQGQPVRGAQAHLTSHRQGGFVCESWNSTDADGASLLPPLHVGALRLVVKAPGFRTQTVDLAPSALARPVRVTLVRA
ncbi:MAG: carboxypeptidase-like regulatory domain-containing protein [Acidobacteria bacterium]|nr:carboxypeptidase-like regulatory domain-containing protein [Acidobacteriota bacterium]